MQTPLRAKCPICHCSSLPGLFRYGITAILWSTRVIAIFLRQWTKDILLVKIVGKNNVVCKIDKILNRMVLIKQKFIVKCLNFHSRMVKLCLRNWNHNVLTLLLHVIWLDVLKSKSCKHWRNGRKQIWHRASKDGTISEMWVSCVPLRGSKQHFYQSREFWFHTAGWLEDPSAVHPKYILPGFLLCWGTK